MDETLQTLQDAIASARAAALATDGEPPPEAHALTDLELRMRKLRRAWGRPQSLGFFGPSQAGKSFLVGALLSHELGTLMVRSREGEVDFLQDINPAKGVESTGTVTRFSTAEAPSPLTRGDFHCRLLSLEVMLESMATGFLVECTAPPIDAERVERVLREARLASGPPAPRLYREAWDTVWHDLLKKYQDRHPYLNELRRHPELRTETWKKGIGSVAGWSQVFSLLWGGRGYSRDLDALADKLVSGLEQLGHPESVEVDLDYVRASSTNPSVIDAACLNAIGTPQGTMQVYVPEAQQEVSIEPSVLAALIAEIRLPLRPVAGSLLENTDLLDFPGGRALRGINGFEANELNTGNLENAIEVFKRGKLTFLFEQFSLDREITALVLASPGPTKPEAIQMQHQVERWLQIRHGAPTPTAAEEIERPSLFMALTKFDMSLGALRSDNARDRWDSRVEEACVEFWARSHHSWIYRWGENDQPFTNMFWIRNPYADQMNTLKPGQSDYDAVKRGYHESRAVRTFIASHGDKWAAMEGEDEQGLPRSGIPLLASHLRAKLADDIKRRELTAELRAIHGELLEALKLLTPSRDEAEQRARLEHNALALVSAVKAEMTTHYSGAVFGELIELVTLPQDELELAVRRAYKQLAPMSIKVSDKVKKLMVHVLKHWSARAVSRVRSSPIELPAALVERYVREVCTSKMLLPILGKAIFPYFNKSEVDYALVAQILRVKISDALLHLFAERSRQTPEIPVRLSYSETVGGGEAEPEDAIDWADVSFDDEPEAEEPEHVDIVFAGNRFFEHWAAQLPAFYVRNAGGKVQSALDDPRTKKLVDALGTVEAVRV
ncbi:MAG TPA: virulence factor SrfC family protein [Sandaracinaceae bacterium LLY-WYZ-13_1]|nr:virulence factor SrfC family protein [Sandaracinaceae bacterium LLY-WYZ-13_1]